MSAVDVCRARRDGRALVEARGNDSAREDKGITKRSMLFSEGETAKGERMGLVNVASTRI